MSIGKVTVAALVAAGFLITCVGFLWADPEMHQGAMQQGMMHNGATHEGMMHQGKSHEGMMQQGKWHENTMQQGESPRGMMQQDAMGKQQPAQRVVLASRLLGTTVRNTEDKELGQVEDIVLDHARQKISYVMVNRRTLKIFEKRHAVPWQAFQPLTIHCDKTGQSKCTLVLDISQKQFEQSRGVPAGRWPDEGEQTWLRVAAGKASPQGMMGQMAEGNTLRYPDARDMWARRLSHVIGLGARTLGGTEVGEVTDVIAKAHSGDVTLAVVWLEYLEPGSDELAAVPWPLLQVDQEGGLAVVDADTLALRQAAFARGAMPDFSRPSQVDRIYSAYNMQTGPEGPAYAGLGEQSHGGYRIRPVAGAPVLSKGSTLIGMDVQSSDGKDVGSIEELILDTGRDEVSYAVLSLGGLKGTGDRFFAVPWQVLGVNRGRSRALLDLDSTELGNAPGFQKDNWPDMGDPRWRSRVDRFYGVTSAAARQGRRAKMAQGQGGAEGQQGMQHGTMAAGHIATQGLSELIGLGVKSRRADTDLGDVEDIVFDLGSGRVLFAIVGYGGVLGYGQEMAAVPWTALSIQTQPRVARLDATPTQLRESQIDINHIGRLADRDYAEKLYARFGTEPYWGVYAYRGERHPQRIPAAWRPESPYNQSLDFGKTRTVHGTVTSVGTFDPGSGRYDGLRLRIRTDGGQSRIVYAGPKAVAASRGFWFRTGDEVRVQGSPSEVNRRNVLVATRISKDGGRTLTLRDVDGNPEWTAEDFWSAQQPSRRMQGQPMNEQRRREWSWQE